MMTDETGMMHADCVGDEWPEEYIECIDDHDGGCSGAVRYRMSLTGTDTPIPRCETHWQKRLQREEEHRQNYPDSACPPSWYDYLNAGEHWDDY